MDTSILPRPSELDYVFFVETHTPLVHVAERAHVSSKPMHASPSLRGVRQTPQPSPDALQRAPAHCSSNAHGIPFAGGVGDKEPPQPPPMTAKQTKNKRNPTLSGTRSRAPAMGSHRRAYLGLMQAVLSVIGVGSLNAFWT